MKNRPEDKDGKRDPNQNNNRPFDPDKIIYEDMKALRQPCKDHSKGHHEVLRYDIACAYGILQDINHNEQELSEIRNDALFDDMRQPPNKANDTAWVVLSTFSANKGGKREQVMRYVPILDRYREEGVRPSKVEQQLVDEGGIQKAYLLSTNPDEQDQQDDDGENPVEQDQDDEPDQDGDGKGLAALNRGQAKAAKVSRTKAKTSTAEKGVVKLELISGRPEAWQALKPGPATLSLMVEPKPQLGDSDWLEIRLLRVKRRG